MKHSVSLQLRINQLVVLYSHNFIELKQGPSGTGVGEERHLAASQGEGWEEEGKHRMCVFYLLFFPTLVYRKARGPPECVEGVLGGAWGFLKPLGALTPPGSWAYASLGMGDQPGCGMEMCPATLKPKHKHL